MVKLTQEQLDEVIRREKGQHAVEGLTWNGPSFQVYTLDNGWELEISKEDGSGAIRRPLRTRWIVVKRWN